MANNMGTPQEVSLWLQYPWFARSITFQISETWLVGLFRARTSFVSGTIGECTPFLPMLVVFPLYCGYWCIWSNQLQCGTVPWSCFD